jgi:hypothetical protein
MDDNNGNGGGLFGKGVKNPDELPGVEASENAQTQTSPTAVPVFTSKAEGDGNVPEALLSPNSEIVQDAQPESTDAAEENDGNVRYISPTTSNLKVGQFQFENGVLALKPDEVDKFEKLVNDLGPSVSSHIRKVADEATADAAARRILERNGGSMIRGGDHTGNIAPAPNPSDADNQPE